MNCPDYNSPQALKKILDEKGFAMQKKFGQNFLCDEGIIDRIIEEAEIKPGDTVLEIGPGIGALTERLSALDIHLICVEIDKRLVSYLKRAYPDTCIIDFDFLKLKDYGAENVDIVISNLPYYIMTDIMMKIFEEDIRCDSLIFMMQKEVAERNCMRKKRRFSED